MAGRIRKEQIGMFPGEVAEITTKPPENIPEIIPGGVSDNETPHQWHMRKWSELATFQWQHILKEAIESGDKKREEYARELLKSLEVKDER
jgi:hypothetical protein